jgi:outer membrane protein assembly factor BamB
MLKVVVVFNLVLALLIGGGCKKDQAIVSDASTPINYVLAPQVVIPAPSLAGSAWPMARHDPQCTGRSQFQGPSIGRIRATVPAGPEITDPVFSSDDRYYFGSGSTLYAASLLNGILLRFETDSHQYLECPPFVGSDGTIYIGSTAGTLYAVNPDSSLKWALSLGGGAIYTKTAAVGLDGTIYIRSGTTLFAVSNSGGILWQRQGRSDPFNSSIMASTSLSPDGQTLYVPAGPRISLYALDLSGNFRWADSLGGMGSGSPAVDNTGNVFLFAGSDLVSVSPIGKLRWRIPATGPNWDVTIDINGNVDYLTQGYLVSVDNIGQERWRVKLDADDDVTHLVSDALGTVYVETGYSVASHQYNVYAVSMGGQIKWKLPVVAYIKVGGPSLSSQGYLMMVQAGSIGGAPDQLYIIE